MVHRVASSGLYASGLHEIQTVWTLDDLLDATIAIDLKQHLDYLASQPDS